MTGIIGDHGAHSPSANHRRHDGKVSLIYAKFLAISSITAQRWGSTSTNEEITVVGIPGSIATGVASRGAPRCRRLVVGARRVSARAVHWAATAGRGWRLDLPKAPADASLRGDRHIIGQLYRAKLAPAGLLGARRRRAQRRPPKHAAPRRRADPFRRLCTRARDHATRLFSPPVLITESCLPAWAKRWS